MHAHIKQARVDCKLADIGGGGGYILYICTIYTIQVYNKRYLSYIYIYMNAGHLPCFLLFFSLKQKTPNTVCTACRISAGWIQTGTTATATASSCSRPTAPSWSGPSHTPSCACSRGHCRPYLQGVTGFVSRSRSRPKPSLKPYIWVGSGSSLTKNS